MLKKSSPTKQCCKYSCSDLDFQEFTVIKKLKVSHATQLLPCYTDHISLNPKRKADLQKLVERNLIPYFACVSMGKRGERLGAMQIVPGSIPGGSIEMLGELNSGDSI